MPKFGTQVFRGRSPLTPDRALQPEQATVATNLNLQRGNLEPLKSLAGVAATLRTGVIRSLFLYERTHWFSWNEAVSAINSPIAQDDYARVYYTGNGAPKVTSNLIATGGDPKPTASYKLGIQAPAIAITVAVTPTGANPADFSDDEDRSYVMTYVTEYGEEGPPGPASPVVTLTDPSGDAVTLTLPTPSTNTENITHKRIYRTFTSGSSTDFYLVAEVALSLTTIQDTASTPGKLLDTDDFVELPSNAQGLVMMANGIAVAFAGNEIMPSEPYLPYAYPTGYRRSLGWDIVAIAAIGNSLIVATKGLPYLITGISPSAFSERKLELKQAACASARSMVDMGDFAIYASNAGLVIASPDRAELITEKVITPEQWEAKYFPETIHAYHYRGDYIGFYGDTDDNGTGIGGFIFRPETGDIVDLDFYATAGFNDLETERLYLVQRASGANSLVMFDQGDLLLPYTWRSKLFEVPVTSFARARVLCDNPGLVSWKLFVDGVQVQNKASLNDEIVTLPDVSGRAWQFEVSGTAKIESIEVAQSVDEL